MLEFCSFFVGRSNHLSPIGKANPLIGMLANLYTPIARERVKRLFYRFPLEIELAKHLRLYAPRHRGPQRAGACRRQTQTRMRSVSRRRLGGER